MLWFVVVCCGYMCLNGCSGDFNGIIKDLTVVFRVLFGWLGVVGRLVFGMLCTLAIGIKAIGAFQGHGIRQEEASPCLNEHMST